MNFTDYINSQPSKSPKAEKIEEIAEHLQVDVSTIYRNLKDNSFKPLHKRLISEKLNIPENELFPNL